MGRFSSSTTPNRPLPEESDASKSEVVADFEGDYRPAAIDTPVSPNIRIEASHTDFLHRLADALNTTLDLQTLMHRVADLVRAVVDYRIFAVLLLNDRTQELWMRFQVGHTPEIERMRIRIGQGVVGEAAERRASIRIDDVTEISNYINANPEVRSELAVPLIVKNKVIGVLDIESELPSNFTDDQRRLLELVASRMAIAIENARLYTRVSRQAQTLTVLNEISRELTSILDLDDLLERIGTLLKRVVDFQMFTILLWSQSQQQFVHRFSTRYGEVVSRERNAPLGVGIIGNAAKDRAPILASDVRKDPRYIEANEGVRSELAVPLIYKGNVIGVIDLEHTRLNYYNEDHQRTLTTLAGQIAIAITNARLYERIREDEQRMERDLEMARQVQLRLLPAAAPAMLNAEIAAEFLAARSIGGDVYDFIPYGENRLAIAIGDVSGKAAPAALYAALVSGILRSLAAQHLSPGAMLAAMNDQLQERRLDAQYVTMLFAIWNGENRTLQIANAGSVQPLFVTGTGENRSANAIQAEGFPLGLFPNADYEEFTVSTQPGDVIVFYSDGIVDAENRLHAMFGTDRLCALLQETNPTTAKETVDTVLRAVDSFQAGADHFDDETVVVLQVL
ncbi:SpoIIE family protein phosphatase [Terriglobus saanensis]|uniref:Protein serine phosphatase with GAF(S) sensor(S) n=1 Tax=Terriglobus saanensis (strain ATCC BAA-1853 / DSM 23119 / SP1PR4) TaxID=401053 RepID=E8V5S5_TERSS|nr:SpoIIE family protein phosphatase [Terriglobus saanensis]ADV82684.1 protein serine phosphatase with GAF(s) sensor(s) [Terriglobus saanensis SP1PR4]